MDGNRVRFYLFVGLALIFNCLFIFSPTFEIISYSDDGNILAHKDLIGYQVLLLGIFRGGIDYFFLLVRFFSLNLMPDSNDIFSGYLFFLLEEVLFFQMIIGFFKKRFTKKMVLAHFLMLVSLLFFFFCFDFDGLEMERVGNKYIGYYFCTFSQFFLCCAILTNSDQKMRKGKL